MDRQIRAAANEQEYLILTLIINDNQSHKVAHISLKKDIRGGILLLGKGTVKSAALNLLGIRSQKKVIINILLEKERAKEALNCFTKELQLLEPGHGIAYTTPVITAGQIINNKREILNIAQGAEEESMYKKMTVVVNRGMAEDVMDIARKLGVKGGTIMHGRGTGPEFTEKIFGMEMEPEKELVIILMPSELIDKVTNALYKELQLDNPGNGILFVEPVLEVRGLFDSKRNNKDA